VRFKTCWTPIVRTARAPRWHVSWLRLTVQWWSGQKEWHVRRGKAVLFEVWCGPLEIWVW
jgi:hypothetical protein